MSQALKKIRGSVIAAFKTRKINSEEGIDFLLWFGVNTCSDQSTQSAYIEVSDSSDEDGGQNGDTASVSTYSTNATTDDLPGPGRLLDKYIYQRGGRFVERFVMKWKMSTLHPAHIVRYLSPLPTCFAIDCGVQLENIILRIETTCGSAAVAGIEGLVQQTQ